MMTNFHKCKAIRTDGFPSKLEKAVYELLLLRERAKEISEIRRQVPVVVTVEITTKVDFSAIDNKTGQTFYIEAKGMEDDRFKLIKKGWRKSVDGVLEIWKGKADRLKLAERIEPHYCDADL